MVNMSEQAENFINNFINYIKENEDLKQNTLKEYTGDLKHFIDWFEVRNNEYSENIVIFHPKNIITPDIRKYRETMQNSIKLKPSTINRRIITLKRFFKWAIDNGFIKRNPVISIKLVKAEKSSPRKTTEKEISELVAAVQNNGILRDQMIIILLIHTGIRTMELCNLLKTDIFIGKRSGYLVIRSGKRNKNREVPLNSTCRYYLEKYLPKIPEDGYLFPSSKTKSRLTERALRHLIQKYMDIAKLKGLSAHNLRHYFGYVMVEHTPIHRLAQIMGHDSLDTTMIYVKATREDLQKEVEKIAWK